MRSIITDLRAARAIYQHAGRAARNRLEEHYAFGFCCRRPGDCRLGLER